LSYDESFLLLLFLALWLSLFCPDRWFNFGFHLDFRFHFDFRFSFRLYFHFILLDFDFDCRWGRFLGLDYFGRTVSLLLFVLAGGLGLLYLHFFHFRFDDGINISLLLFGLFSWWRFITLLDCFLFLFSLGLWLGFGFLLLFRLKIRVFFDILFKLCAQLLKLFLLGMEFFLERFILFLLFLALILEIPQSIVFAPFKVVHFNS
jgi:hypothetical protein